MSITTSLSMESLFIWARFWSGEIEAFFSRWRDIEIFFFFFFRSACRLANLAS